MVNGTFDEVQIEQTRRLKYRRAVQGQPVPRQPLNNYRYFGYFGGIDGNGTLADAFGGGFVYSHVLVPDSDLSHPGTKIKAVSQPVLSAHAATLVHLRDDDKGHLRADHPLRRKLSARDLKKVKDEIGASADHIRAPNTLIFVEIEHQNNGFEIVSLGQNYRYRWRFADTVHKKSGNTRPILKPLASEEPVGGTEKNRHPRALSGARLLFGYVAEDPNGAKNPGAAGIGAGDFRQLAGRLAFNIAVGQTADGKDEARFLKGAEAIPLKILGQPKPSAAEEYLRQPRTADGKIDRAEVRKIRRDRGEYISYGDIAGQEGGELAGRKFYYHQPNAATDQDCYRLNETKQEEAEHIAGDQAALARFVSKPGTQFRFTLRFQDLRPWELGAVLVALDPARLNGSATPATDANPEYALKLGHARPLGFGSVAIAVDGITLVDQRGVQRDGKVEEDSWVADFRAKGTPLAANVQAARDQWRKLHGYRGRAGRTFPLARPAQYVRIKDGEVVAPERDHGDKTIFNHYTTNRRKHSLGRRLSPPGGTA